MILATCDLTLNVHGPVMTQSSAIAGFGISAAMAQTSGHYYLPGTLVKGRLREAWEELMSAAPGTNWPIDDWLGRKKGNRTDDPSLDFDPKRARIYVTDLKDGTPASQRIAATRYRIRIDEQRGSVEKGAFLILEAPYSSGEVVSFSGSLRLLAKDSEELSAMRIALFAGLRWVSALGAEKSVGFGRLESACISEPSRVPLEAGAGVWETTVRMGFRLSFREPLAVGTRRPSGNLFESDDRIPGATIRGAIGELLDQGLGAEFPELKANLAKVRVTHAFPARAGAPRPLQYPMSLFKVGGKLHDAALLENAPEDLEESPEFDIDWKDSSDVNQLTGWPEVERELRVRTGIESERRKARDEALFGVRLIVSGSHEWVGSVDLSRIADPDTQQKVAQQLAGIFKAGLPGIGKTKAFAKIQHHEEEEPPLRERNDRCFIVCLQSPALFLAPDRLPKERGRDEWKNAYAEAWADLSGRSLALERCFQRTSLAGGDYLYHRFRAGRQYRPYLLTNAGSVFVFQASNPGVAKKHLEDWLRHGLPLPAECRRFYCDGAGGGDASDLWKLCPYLPENGYGEIAVNLQIHQEKAWESN